MTTILYNGINPFSGVGPTPLFARSVSMIRFGSRWGQKHSITLQGQMTGRCVTYQEMLDKKTLLLQNFSKDFQSLNIYDENTFVTGFDFVKINGIQIDDSTYAQGVMPYTIDLEAYPENYFLGAYGILNPLEQVSFQDNDDGTIKISHTTSAQGFCTSSTSTNDALMNAKNWVAARTGWQSAIAPNFISGIQNGVCLQTIAENYDRLNAKYEVTESYLGSLYDDVSQGVLKYSTDYSLSLADGISTMQIQGDLKGCRYQDLAVLRSRYLGFDAFSECVNQFQRITNRSDLNNIPVTKAASEDVNGRMISFNYVFNDDMRPKINITIGVNFAYNFEADEVSATITATVASKGVYDSSRWPEVLQIANSINLYSLIVPYYNAYVAEVAPHLSAYPLKNNPTSTSRSDNQFAASVTLSATFTNGSALPNGLDTLSSTISVKPSLHKYSAAPILDGNGQYYIFDLGYKTRGVININLEGLGNEALNTEGTLAILKTQAQNYQIDYLPGSRKVLDAQSYATGNAAFGRNVSLQAQFSAESTEFTL